MRKVFIALLFVAFAMLGANAVQADQELCGTTVCTSVDLQSSDGPIGSTVNSSTRLGTCTLINPTASTTAYWGIRKYASVATGAIQLPHIYAVPVTQPQTVTINTKYANGLYADALTGTVIRRCSFTK